MSEIYVPIDSSDVKEVIPPGEDIIFSSLAKAHGYSGNSSVSWNTHVLFTSNGIAFKRPEDFGRKKSPMINIYAQWEAAHSFMSVGKMGAGFTIRGCTLGFVLNKDVETKEKFQERTKEFIAKYRPYLIEKKEKYVEELSKDPKENKRYIKAQTAEITKLKNMEIKRLKKAQK